MKIDKILEDEKIERLVRWVKGMPQSPLILEIWPTFKCNLKCLFCDYRYKRDTNDEFALAKDIEDKRWIEAIKEAKKLDVKMIRIVGGGEPLVRYGLTLSLMKLVKKLGMIGTLTTNGTLFTKEGIKEIVKMGWEKIEFSLDGPNSEINDYLRQKKGSFQKVVENVKLFTYYKKRFRSDYPKLFFSTVVTNINYNKIEEFMKLAASIGVECVSLLELIVKTPESQNLQLDEKQYEEIYKELLRLKRKEKLFGVSLGCEGFLHSKHFSFSKKEKKQPSKESFLNLACYEPWYYMQIIYDGRVSPCCACFPSDNSEKITNHSLQQLWIGKHLSKVREDILRNELSTQCKQCSSWQTERALNIRKELMMALS